MRRTKFFANGSPNLGQTTRPNESQRKKRTYRMVDFAIPADHRVKLKENEKRDKYLDLARERKNLLNIRVTVISIVIGTVSTVTKGLIQGMEDLETRGKWRPTIVEIGQNTKKSSGDLRRLAVTQTPEENHQLGLI